MRRYVLTALFLLCPVAGVARAQEDRFGRFEPGLIVQTGSRMGACDVLLFTLDGKYLLAAGDDKIVPIWKVTADGLGREPVQVLRWSSFREQKGSIYAMALSPNDGGQRVVVAGMGVRVGGGAVINRSTGEVEFGLDTVGANVAIWSIAFSPSGKLVAAGRGDGSVVLWDLTEPPDRTQGENVLPCHLLGKHTPGQRPINDVRTIFFTQENRCISVAQNGEVLQWDINARKADHKALFAFDCHDAARATVSEDRKWIAVANQVSRRDQVEVRSLDGSLTRPFKIALERDRWPNCLAFDRKRERLAVGIRTVPHGASFFYEASGSVAVYDLTGETPRRLYEVPVTYYPEAVAFHPDGEFLAVAGGDNNEVTCWDVSRNPPVRRGSNGGPGTSLWGVGLSTKGRVLGFRDQRNPEPRTPNDRGRGPWRAFDLDQRKWVPSADFQPVAPITTLDGWSVEPSTEDGLIWYLRTPDKQRIELPLDSPRDHFPRCYTFLPRTATKPVRLAVGHAWGLSIFELSNNKARRSRVLIGHQGEVMAVGLSADHKMLVSASRDQTIAGWDLADWPTHPDWGVRFLLRQNKIVVDEVDAGSPVWDSGLSRGDEIVSFVFDGVDMYDPEKNIPEVRRKNMKETYKTPEAVLQQFKVPQPNTEYYFLVRREGKKGLVKVSSRVLHRPLWRFLPLNNGEWVLWRWRDYFYDASTNGDSYIGWQVNGDVDKTPVFYRAEQFRQRFNRPDKVSDALSAQATPEKIIFTEIEPPDVRLRASGVEVKDQDLAVSLSARPRGDNDLQKLTLVMLWVNDYRSRVWSPATDPAAFKADGSFEVKELLVPPTVLRQGQNVLTLQCYNKAGGRGEAVPVQVACGRSESEPRLFGLAVGVGDYSKSVQRKKKSKVRLGDLNADKDARAIADMWQEQAGRYFKQVEVKTLLNQEATPKAVLDWLQAVNKQVRPDDRVLIFLGGHGTSAEELERIIKKTDTPVIDTLSPRSFAMLGPEFDVGRPNKTGITSLDMYEAITRINCHKLVLLDACHSGAVAVNPVRELTRDGVGPVIVAACAPNEQAIEFGLLDANRSFGLFTMALRRALDDEFNEADKDHNGVLTSTELVDFLTVRVPKLVEQLKEDKIEGIRPGDTQTPSVFLPRLERALPWAKN